MKVKNTKAVSAVPAINGDKKKKKKKTKGKLGNGKINLKASPTEVNVALKDKTAITPTMPLSTENKAPKQITQKKKGQRIKQSAMPVSAEKMAPEEITPKKKGKKKGQYDVRTLTPAEKEEQEMRTIFIGNVSTKVTRKDLHKLFVKYGKVQSVRIRSAPVADPKMSKKAAITTGKFHEKRTSFSAYIRFTEEDMVEAALEANGTVLGEKHIQVDRAIPSKAHNHKMAVFVGNLTFEAEEEDLRSHFNACGDIHNVRIIRDRKMSYGKGFGYINFKSEDAVECALQMHDKNFMGRHLRVQRCQKKPKIKSVKQKGNNQPRKINQKSKARKSKGAQLKTNKLKGDFTGKKMMETKEFKKMQKVKGKMSKIDKKKKSVARQLTGIKPKVKITT